MAWWQCPHCGVPQAETARCWVCRRSSTTCSTCRHFRASLAADLGWCGLDARRRPLTGLELRGCWEGRPPEAGEPAPDDGERPARVRRVAPYAPPSRQPLAFVPLDPPGGAAGAGSSPQALPARGAGADSSSQAVPARGGGADSSSQAVPARGTGSGARAAHPAGGPAAENLAPQPIDRNWADWSSLFGDAEA